MVPPLRRLAGFRLSSSIERAVIIVDLDLQTAQHEQPKTPQKRESNM
jgi:hypothetical protein